MSDQTSAAIVVPLEPVDRKVTAERFSALREAARLAEERIVIGGLCADFTNDEIVFLAEYLLNIGETLTLRRLGLLAPDQGFDGERDDKRVQ